MSHETPNRFQDVSYAVIAACIEVHRHLGPPGHRIDLIVARQLVLEAKAVASLLPIHEAQFLTYLRLTGIRTGLLVNFDVPALRRGGLRRMTLE